jgi:hypothetical protein
VTGVQTCALPISPKPQNPILKRNINIIKKFNIQIQMEKFARKNPTSPGGFSADL